MVFGLGFVLSFGYWCTNFLVIQRAMAAKDMSAARRTPLIAAVPKMLFPFLVIVPGMIAIVLTNEASKGATGGFARGRADRCRVAPWRAGKRNVRRLRFPRRRPRRSAISRCAASSRE